MFLIVDKMFLVHLLKTLTLLLRRFENISPTNIRTVGKHRCPKPINSNRFALHNSSYDMYGLAPG
ncbi:hypothetical protein M758_1G015400 [Ceratodon purpureus]|uniref:Uncharacterized protein n=1 Tax=Ceratodon purpureus TaxID=3225 RepID=A0A8T0J2S1_CERPU|nr:hypothetical protein KC19_N004300 [Ceratodon purpureus]KAG0589366.1 hypothetical protein KC19_1G016200 [Ceratodon purpureus]KAG0628290.1 hypothetical protein M758_1G015400 [Ceratodon purpureus]